MNGMLNGSAPASTRRPAIGPLVGVPALLSHRCGPTGLAGGRLGEEWVITFPPRRRGRNDPLMGWWGGGDPHESLVLRFPTRDAAEAYARREGIRLEVQEEQAAMRGACAGRVVALAAAKEAAVPDPALPWAWDGRVPASLEAEGQTEAGRTSLPDNVVPLRPRRSRPAAAGQELRHAA